MSYAFGRSWKHINGIFGTIGRWEHIQYISIVKLNVLFSINWNLYDQTMVKVSNFEN